MIVFLSSCIDQQENLLYCTQYQTISVPPVTIRSISCKIFAVSKSTN